MRAIQSIRPPSPLAELRRLIEPGLVGYYTHFEATEIFAQIDGQKGALNVFTLLVAEEFETGDVADAPPDYLNPQRIRLPGLKGWTFGIRRYRRPIAELLPALETVDAGQPWQCCGDPLGTGALVPMPFQFVPPDNGGVVPWNRLLKNNFWSGSHLFEWSDYTKVGLNPFFDEPPLLQALTEEIQKHVPISLAAMSDRLGNLAVQLPVTVVVAQFGRRRDDGDFDAEVVWHPRATPRSLSVACGLEHDDVLSGYAIAPLDGTGVHLPMRSGRGFYRGYVWDVENRVVLAATGPGSFIGSIALNLQVADQEPRVFIVTRPDGSADPRRVGLIGHHTQSLVGDPSPDDNGGWTAKRMYKERVRKLEEERRFVQYRPDPGRGDALHQKALEDLRGLIRQYGKFGAWLWDPYLVPADLLETLFYCPHSDADLRALTSPDQGRQRDDLRAELEAVQSNWRGLRLEYRIRCNVGWDFHDRFLIFPGGDDGARAWSLGTSVNGVGKAHHILQQVDNGQLVLDAFVELWNLLSGPDQLVWKKP